MTARIPEGITLDQFTIIEKNLEAIREQTKARQVTLRLNKSDEEIPLSYFVGTVQDAELTKRRQTFGLPDPGLARFGFADESEEYCESLKKPGSIVERDWVNTRSPNYGWITKKPGTKGWGKMLGLNYQVYVAISVSGLRVKFNTGHRSVGMLGVSFFKRDEAPLHLADLQQRIQSAIENCGLIKVLQDNFELAGPMSR